MSESVRVLVVGRSLLCTQALESEQGADIAIELVNHVDTADEAIRQVRRRQPDIVVLETSLPDLDAGEATRRISSAYPDVQIVALSHKHNEPILERMVHAGAVGYIDGDMHVSELAQTIVDILRSHASASVSMSPQSKAKGTLTPRERQVLVLVAEGQNTKEIAAILGISPKTVHIHRANGIRKLDLRGTADVVRWALACGYIDLNG